MVLDKGNLTMAYEIKRFPYAGTIDADGHILEPPDLWENYLEDKYKKRALRKGVDDEGFEYLEIDRKPSKRTRKGSLGLLGAIGIVLFIIGSNFDQVLVGVIEI